MFVARRPFRSYGQMILPGSVVEPGKVKWFKTRVKDRDIIEVTPHNFNEWNEYFKGKFGVSLPNESTAKTTEPAKVVKTVKATITK